MESVIVSRAKDFIENRYGPEAAASLIDELEASHDIELSGPEKFKSDSHVPLAIGATSFEG